MTPSDEQNRYYEDPSQAPARAQVESAARTASGTGTAFRTGELSELEAELVVTAVAGTSPTLNVSLETKTDTGDWYAVASFPQVTAAGTTGRVFTGLGDQCRWAWTLGGTAPSFTFSIDVEQDR